MDRHTANTLAQKLCATLGTEPQNTRVTSLVDDFANQEKVTCTSMFLPVDANKTRRKITKILAVRLNGFQVRLYYQENIWKPPGALSEQPDSSPESLS